MTWQIVYTKRSKKDFKKLNNESKFEIECLLKILSINPYATPPIFEKLSGLKDTYSRRINVQHRLVYKIEKVETVIKVLSMWGHYDDN